MAAVGATVEVGKDTVGANDAAVAQLESAADFKGV
jgi:hypothetical protein